MRMKKDGTPAAKPWRKPKIKEQINKDIVEWKQPETYEDCETYKIKTKLTVGMPMCDGGEGRPDECKIMKTCPFYQNCKKSEEWDKMVYDQIKAKEAKEEKEREEMLGKTIYVKQQKPFILKDEYEKAIDKLEEAAEMDEPEGQMTDEERKGKYPLIATRIESTNGTWEMVGPYKAGETLLGYMTHTDHSDGWPLEAAGKKLLLTVDEWYKLFEELDQVVIMMKL